MATRQAWEPGADEWTQATTSWNRVVRTGGVATGARGPRTGIVSRNSADGARRRTGVDQFMHTTGQPVRDAALSDRDSVSISSLERPKDPEFVTIDGFIEDPRR
ncbi:MAG: hypothetical protein IRZ00_20000 [Gemmatimonadetes bacterium]|nr:hypothetical protein [Gemmatimonadota bacterium]